MSFISSFFAQTEAKAEKTSPLQRLVHNLRYTEHNRFRKQKSVLFAVATKEAWSQGQVVGPFSTVFPSFTIASRCFPNEIEAASVEQEFNKLHVKLKRIENHNRVVQEPIKVADNSNSAAIPSQPTSRFKIVSDKFVVVAVLLHNYDVVFANIGKSPIQFGVTDEGYFLIDRECAVDTVLHLKRPLDPTKDICAVFDAEILMNSVLNTRDCSASEAVLFPDDNEVKRRLRENAQTDEQKKIDVDEFFINLVKVK